MDKSNLSKKVGLLLAGCFITFNALGQDVYKRQVFFLRSLLKLNLALDEGTVKRPSKVFSSASSFTVMVCFPVSTSVITALTVRSVSSFNEPHPDRKRKRVNKHRAIPIPLTFLCSNVLSSCFLLRNLSNL